MDSPGSVSVLTPEFLEEISPTRLYEATRYFAGVSEGRGNSFSDRQILRGFENGGRTVDNFPSIQHHNADGLWIDRVEIVKGPNAILAPTGTPGGSINVVSKVPLDQRMNTLTTIVGLSDAQRVNLDMTGPFSPTSDWAYRVLASYQDGELNLQDGPIRRKMIGGQVGYRVSKTTNVVVRAGYDYRRLYVPFPVYVDSSVVNGGDAKLAEGFSWRDKRDGEEDWSHKSGPYMFSDIATTSSIGEHFNFRVAYKYQYNKIDDEIPGGVVPNLANRYNPATGQLTPDFTWARNATTGQFVATPSPFFDVTRLVRRAGWQRRWSQHYGTQADVAAKYQFGRVSSTTIAGVSLDRETTDFYNKQAVPDLPLFNVYAPVYGAVPNYTLVTNSQYLKGQTLSTYVNERLGLFEDRLFVTAGAVNIQAESSTLNRRTSVFTSLDDAKSVFIYGAVYKPLDQLSLYVSQSSNAVPVIANNQALWREGRQGEIGFKVGTKDKRLMLSGAYFEISQTNVTVPNPAFPNDNTQPQTLISDIENRGFELEIVGGLTKQLSVIASYTHLDQQDSLGRPVRAISPKNAGLLVSYRFTEGPLRKLSAFAGISYVGRRSGEEPAISFTALGVIAQPSFFLAPLTLVSAGLKYAFSDKVSVALNFDNVTDERYFIPTSRAVNTIGEPFNARATIVYKF